jgi:hypothetical protein
MNQKTFLHLALPSLFPAKLDVRGDVKLSMSYKN